MTYHALKFAARRMVSCRAPMHARSKCLIDSTGSLVGSQLINEPAWKQILAAYSGQLTQLDIHEYDAHQQFTSCFESCRKSFPNSDAGYRIRFHGSRPRGGGQILDVDISEYASLKAMPLNNI
jgi:hypothetical protein